jgi:hypothetical protein
MFRTWIGLTFAAAQLQLEAQRVVGLRLQKLALGGPAAQAEARRMLAEKQTAFAEAAFGLAVGKSPKRVVRRLRTHVRANKRRLTRKA